MFYYEIKETTTTNKKYNMMSTWPSRNYSRINLGEIGANLSENFITQNDL